jgi:predicted nucleotidyltransferase
VRLAFRDRIKVVLSGRTLFAEEAHREVWVCGPGAFIVMKALAFRGRGENKDAYDLAYLLRNHAAGIRDVANRLGPLLDDAEAARALTCLDEDFATVDSVGPRRVAEFLDVGNEEVQADAWAAVRDLLDLLLGKLGDLQRRSGSII